jgi:hypothetical protein
MVVSSAALGSTSIGGASALDLYICYKSTMGTIQTWGSGIFDLTAAQNQRHLFTLSAVLSGLPADTYAVGLCGSSTSAVTWNWNEYSYTSALIFQ